MVSINTNDLFSATHVFRSSNGLVWLGEVGHGMERI